MPSPLSYRKSVQFTKSPRTIDEKSRSVEVVGATEQPVEVFDPERWAVVEEVLLMDGAELPASRQLPLLDSHQRAGAASVLGSYREIRVEGGQLMGRVHFSGAVEAESSWTKVREGHLTDFSIGYKVVKSRTLGDGESAVINGRTFTGPLKVTTRWRPKELSVVAIGADDAAKARGERQIEPTPSNIEGDSTMDPKLRSFLITRGLAVDATDEQAWAYLQKLNIPAGSGASDPVVAERERIAEITALCRNHGYPEDRAQAFVTGGVSIENARLAVLDFIASRQIHTPAPVWIQRDAADKFQDAAVDGILLRAGVNVAKPAPGANEYRESSLTDIARECLVASGFSVRGMPRHQLVSKSLELNGRAAVTGDFKSVLTGVANKALGNGYDEAPGTFALWTRKGTASDFKDQHRIQLSEAPDLMEVPEHGQYKYSELADGKETFRVYTYGRMFAITRQALINDDLSAFTRIPMAYALAAKRLINQSVYAVLAVNANMSDGVPLFHGTHGNLGTQGAVGITTLTEGRKLMRLQTGLNGAVLNISPKFIIVPATIETAVEVFLASNSLEKDFSGTANANAGAFANPFKDKLTMIADAALDASSVANWYLAADPAMIDTIEVAYLNGQDRPYLETRDGWTVDGVEYKTRIDFGVKALDWRGMLKNAG